MSRLVSANPGSCPRSVRERDHGIVVDNYPRLDSDRSGVAIAEDTVAVTSMDILVQIEVVVLADEGVSPSPKKFSK
jgi:hypothetical protein